MLAKGVLGSHWLLLFINTEIQGVCIVEISHIISMG